MDLFTAMLDTARLLSLTYAGTATGGSATTLIDTGQKSTADDYWNQGTMFLVSGSRVHQAAIIEDYVNTSRTWTIPTGNAITAGQEYVAVTRQYSKSELKVAVNQALAEIGAVGMKNETLVVLAKTEEYALPAGVSALARVEVALNEAEPYGWYAISNGYWEERDGYLVFLPGKQPNTENRKMRLWYMGQHNELINDTDEISPDINRTRLAWTAAVYAAQARLRLTQNDENDLEKWVKEVAAPMMNNLARKHKTKILPRGRKLAGWV